MRAGLLKETIEVWGKSLTTNEFGEETEEWTLKCTTKARLVHNGGGRVLENEEIFFSHSKTFEIRDYIQVDDYDRIVWQNKKYRILNIEPDKKQMKLTIKAELIDD